MALASGSTSTWIVNTTCALPGRAMKVCRSVRHQASAELRSAEAAVDHGASHQGGQEGTAGDRAQRDRLKPAVLRPQSLRDQQGEVRYYRKEGGTRVAVKLANATNAALDQIELEPGIGSPTLGKLPGIPGLRAWQVAKFPLLWCCFERADHLDVVRLLGKRQDLAAILGD
jgi:toxin ParE1/3/4